MYKIGQLAKKFALARSSLLYYDRIGLLRPSCRSEAGYRLYSPDDAERLQSICAYCDAGLSLGEIGTIIDNLAIPHREFEQRAPEDHHAFLLALDISEKEAIQIRKLSANMENNSMEMDYFYRLYEGVMRLAPSSDSETCRALTLLPKLPENPCVLDIGCGCGAQTLALADQLAGQIVAIDNHQPFLDNLVRAAEKKVLQSELLPQLASMFDLPFVERSFDLIWSEGAIYIVGFAEGLKRWKPLLKPGGCMVVTDMVWLQENPPVAIVEYWQANNPNMTSIAQRLAEAAAAGYQLIDCFTLSKAAWREGYYQPLRRQIERMREELAWNETAEKVFALTEEEAQMYDRYGDSYGYQFFLLRLPGK